MDKTKSTSKRALSGGYAALLKKVKQTLSLGRQRVELEKVKTYWKTGKLIHEHILSNKDRAKYGKQLIEKLSEDFEVDSTRSPACALN